MCRWCCTVLRRTDRLLESEFHISHFYTAPDGHCSLSYTPGKGVVVVVVVGRLSAGWILHNRPLISFLSFHLSFFSHLFFSSILSLPTASFSQFFNFPFCFFSHLLFISLFLFSLFHSFLPFTTFLVFLHPHSLSFSFTFLFHRLSSVTLSSVNALLNISLCESTFLLVL